LKRSALRILACPRCKGALELHVQAEQEHEVTEGDLTCRVCAGTYPIRSRIPRFVDSGAYADSFGFQWNRFRLVQLDSRNGTRSSELTLAETTSWTDADYRGRLVLDAGVGAGRFAEVAAKKGAEVVGIDLTRAVEAAHANVGHLDNVHLIQADIFAMPFRDETFDLAYSIGVLHHTHDVHTAFGKVAAAVKPGGMMAVYLYAAYGVDRHFSDALRVLTTRLPLRVMFGLSAAAVPLYYLYRVPVAGRILARLAPISLNPDWRWRWLDTFDWYTPRYQWKLRYPEVLRWFRESGFTDIQASDEPIRMSGSKRGPTLRRAEARR
jgi:SAM-dependent methyltransferase